MSIDTFKPDLNELYSGYSDLANETQDFIYAHIGEFTNTNQLDVLCNSITQITNNFLFLDKIMNSSVVGFDLTSDDIYSVENYKSKKHQVCKLIEIILEEQHGNHGEQMYCIVHISLVANLIIEATNIMIDIINKIYDIYLVSTKGAVNANEN